MKTAIIGGGPSGLYLAILLRKINIDVDVFEQNAPDATFGFGVTLADKALDRFRAADADSYDDIDAAMVWISSQRIRHPERDVMIDTFGQAGSIERLKLLEILTHHAERHGVRLMFEQRVKTLEDLSEYDLVVGADGSNSFVRDSLSDALTVRESLLNNRFAWYGVDVALSTPTLSFKPYEGGAFCGHYYPYAANKSTFVAECDAAAWQASGLGDYPPEEQRAFIEKLFVDDLEGASLVDNRSIWRRFNHLSVKPWAHSNTVLIGDALYPAHFSIGSGTRLAMEDAISLAEALRESDGAVETALHAFQDGRAAKKQKLQQAAEKSAQWYENMAEHMAQPALAFAYDYMTRTGRMDDMRLSLFAPGFMAEFTEWRDAHAARLEGQN